MEGHPLSFHIDQSSFKRLAAHTLSICLLISAFVATPALGQNHLQMTDGAGLPGTDVPVTLELTSDFALLGWSFGICVDPAELTPLAAQASPGILALNPEFDESQLTAEGIGNGLILSFDPLQTLAPQAGFAIYESTFTLVGAAGTQAAVDLCETIGIPPIELVFSGPGMPFEVQPTTTSGTITIETPMTGDPQFLRGDCNSDATFNIADGIALLDALFGGGAAPTCDLACDTNDDETINIADAINILDVLFGGMGDTIPAPSDACGVDPSPASLSCAMGPCP